MNTFLKVASCALLLQACLGQAFAAPADPFMTEKRVAALATASALEGALEQQCNFSAAPALLELPETIARALCQNPQTRGAWANAQAQAALVGVAKSAYLPSAAANFGYIQQNSSNRYDSYPILDSKTTPKTRSGSLKMSWTIADSGLRSANLEQANALLDAANASHDFTIQNTFLAAAQAYFDAQMASAVLKATREAEHSAQQSLNATEAKYAAGVGALSDTLQAAVALSDARLKRVTAEGELKNAIGALSTAIGLPPYTQLKLPERSDVLPDTSFVKSAEELFTEAREHHPALLAARSEVQAAQARIKATQAEGRPSVTFSAEANERRQDNYLPAVNIAPTQAAFRDKVMGVQLNIPLFEGFGRGYKERAASSQADIKAAELAKLEQQISLDIWKNYQSLNTQTEHIEAARTLLSSARHAFAVADGRFKAGVGNILELLSAQSAVASAEQRRIQALAGWLNARLKLAGSIGKLGMWAIR